MHNFRFLFALLLATIFMPVIALASESGVALRSDIIRGEPYSDAKKTGDMTRGDKLEINNKKGAWLNIKTAKAKGWVRLLAVKRGNGNNSGNEGKGVLDLASGRAGTGKVVATAGVRGMSEEDLRNARFNEAETQKMEGYTQPPEQGSKFASKGKLRAVQFDYLSD
jgi:hypothetical protein